MRTPIIVPLEILKPYVAGKVYEYFSSFEKAPDAEGIHNYVTHTLDFVVPYLNGKEVLNARASDTQCQIAQSAYVDFKRLYDNSNKNAKLVEAQTALRNLSYKDTVVTESLEAITRALEEPGHFDPEVLALRLRILSRRLLNNGQVVPSVYMDEAVMALLSC